MKRSLPNLAFFISFLVGMGVWHIIAVITPHHLIPSPIRVLPEMGSMALSFRFIQDAGATCVRIATGVAASFVISFALSLLTIPYPLLSRLYYPFIILGQTIPAVVATFIAIIIFGTSEWTPFLVVLTALIPQMIITYSHGIQAVEQKYLMLGTIYHIPRRSVWIHIYIPRLIPFVVTSIRNGLSVACKIVILVESFILSNGIGYEIRYQFEMFSLTHILAWSGLLGLILIITDTLLSAASHYFLTKYNAYD